MAALTDTARSPAERLEQILAVTKDDVRKAAGEVFRADVRSLVAVGTSKGGVKSALEKLALV
jgi:predicted Zn-dependent peptidase